jgi:hypothetical protein
MVGESWLESTARDWIQTLDFITGPRMNVSEMIIPHLTCLKMKSDCTLWSIGKGKIAQSSLLDEHFSLLRIDNPYAKDYSCRCWFTTCSRKPASVKTCINYFQFHRLDFLILCFNVLTKWFIYFKYKTCAQFPYSKGVHVYFDFLVSLSYL